MFRLIISIIAFVYIIFPHATQAEQALTVSATPVFSLVTVNPGSTATRQLTLSNKSALALNVTIESKGFKAKDDHGGSDFPNSKSGPQHWFSFSPNSFQIAPQSSRVVTATIQVPRDAVSGGQYASVFFVASAPPDPTGQVTQVNFSARIGTFFFMTVGGNLHSDGEVTQFSTKQFWQHTPVQFQINVHNFGNIHIKPHSVLTIKNFFGTTVEQDNDAGLFVLPGTSRKWELDTKKKLSPGYYTASLSTKITSKSKSTVKTTGFWILPWQLITILILTCLFGFIILRPQVKSLKALYKLKGGNKWLKQNITKIRRHSISHVKRAFRKLSFWS